MMISAPCVVALTWKLTDAQGQAIDELADPVEFYFGGDDLLPKVEEELADHGAGDELTLHLEPEHAFGEYDPALVFFEARSLFDQTVSVGLAFDGPPPGTTTPGLPPEAVYHVTEVYPEHVVLDGNHPLAGIALRLAIKVAGVREATEAEIEAGSVGEPIFTVMQTAPSGTPLH